MVQHTYVVQHHRAVLSVIIDCCRYLSGEMQGLRSSSSVEGKLFNLFRLMSKYNADASVYLQKIEERRNDPNKSKMQVNFLAYRSLLKLILTMKEMVLETIGTRIVAAEKYAIIADSTQDCSKLETVVVLVCYIEDQDQENFGISLAKPVERIVGAFTTGLTTGTELSEKCLSLLEECKLNLNCIVGQSYDGAANMRGSSHGMQSLIQEKCPSAVYIWCYAHRFALVVEQALNDCIPIRNYFGILEELYVFMSGHRRHSVFVETLKTSTQKIDLHLSKKRLKRVTTTRWNSKSAANKTIGDCYGEILSCLEIIENDKSMGRESVTKAASLRKHMTTFKFIAALKICTEIFDVLSPVTTVLQGINVDLGAASLIIGNTIRRLKTLRTDAVLNRIIKSAKEMCLNFSIDIPGPSLKPRRKHVRKRFFDEIGIENETQFDEIQKLKVETFFSVIDILLMALNNRFNENILTLF